MMRILLTSLLVVGVAVVGIPPAQAAEVALSGTVTGPGGAPVAVGTMYASNGEVNEEGERISFQDDLSDAGTFTIVLPAGNYRLCTSVDSGVGLADQCRNVTVGASGLSGVRFQLEPLPLVSGVVLNDARIALRNLTVEMYEDGEFTGSSSSMTAQTNAEGRFTVPARPGTYSVCAGSETGSPVDRRCIENVVVSDAGGTANLVLPRNSVLTGKIRVAGNPYADLSDLNVDLYEKSSDPSDRTRIHSATVRADGSYAVAVPPNEYTLRFRSVWGSPTLVEEWYSEPFTLEPGAVAGPSPVLEQKSGLMGSLTVTGDPQASDSSGAFMVRVYPENPIGPTDYAASARFSVPSTGASTIRWAMGQEPGRYRVAFYRESDEALLWYGGGNVATAPLITVADGVPTQGLDATWGTTLPAYTFGQPTIRGVAKVGPTLTAEANPDTWPASTRFTYKWSDGTTGPTRLVTANDWQAYAPMISVEVTGTTPGYAPVTRVSPIAPVAAGPGTKPPTSAATRQALRAALAGAKVKGPVRVGKTVKVQGLRARVLNTKVTYQVKWLVGAKAVKKATKAQLRIPRSAKGKKLSVKVTAAASGVTVRRTVSAGKVSAPRAEFAR